ncbi:DNA polymerase-3 subunit delta [Mesonia hippocampi]|uniref:DNA polymerase III subunit delta n=1 Tax=Mesonia hippocampi TaxID=1628250 RepID=A0A840ESI2_9FLAO|nr:DNA polymerase III subunit delta [Mesonia hippocampi]MBB4119930.1 DNA polymerase-3 subunit delta [Mesonia hippocampi]
MQEVDKILNDIKNRKFKPIYFLMGEEPYYIDVVADFIENHVLTEDEKGFNLSILYGRDIKIADIIANARRYPMMAEYQVVIVREAQDLHKSIESLIDYVNNMQPTTILVMCYKYKKLDGRKALSKAVKKAGVLFESKPLYESKIPDWIVSQLKKENYSITMKGAVMLEEFLGNDLGKINNELQKLQLILPKGSKITPELIEENIGISKDFNNFELQKALGIKDYEKAFRILNYYAQNPKANPILRILPVLYFYFSKLLIYHSLSDKSNQAVANALKVNPYFVNDYALAAKSYTMKEVSQIISTLRELDMKAKGVGGNSLTPADLFKEILIKIAA